MSAVGSSNSSTTSQVKTTAAPGAFVDIYPFEGGSFSLYGAQVMRLTVEKSIKADFGTFEIVIAPQILSGNQSWAQIITPMSLAVIGLSRGDKSNIVMIGVIHDVSEPQEWNPEQPVTRSVTVRGRDLSYYFTMADYYSLWYLAVSQTDASSITTAGLMSGGPGEIGQNWFDLMISNTGCFANSYVPYQNAQVKFNALFGQQFDSYPVFVPYGDYFLGTDGSWAQKFRKIFPFPIYEFFVTTAIDGNYTASGGQPMWVKGMGSGITSTPICVGRLNPCPKLVTSTESGGAASFDSMDVSLWNALPTFDLQGVGFVGSYPRFGEEEVFNFYNINPTWLNGLNGVSNSNIVMGTLLFCYALDQASVSRYGYRPILFDVPWFADPTGQSAKQSGSSVQQTYSQVLGELAGYFEATPLMAKADITTWMRPDIQIGCRFQFNPYKTNQQWTFYIETVRHNFVYGQGSTTSLGLTRGLPSDVYNDSGAGGMLYNIHIGNAQRVNGVYTAGLPSGGPQTGLKSFTPTQFASLVATLNSMYTTPQATVTTQGGNPT